MKIGYQGVSGCHSQSAAKQLAEKAGIFEPEFLPLGNAENVVKTLMKGGIDYGVLPVYNSVSGAYKETEDALRDVRYMKVTALIMPIRECVFKRSGLVSGADINKVVSDASGLGATKEAVSKYFPYAKLIEEENSAVSAEKLANGEYDDYTAVICCREAGFVNGLSLLYENIEDNDRSRSLYYLISREPK